MNALPNLVREESLSEVTDLRDESDRNGMRIIIELKRSAQPKRVLNRLYKFTQLQSTFGINMLALGQWRTAPAAAQTLLADLH